MSKRRVVWRNQAIADAASAIDHYRLEVGESLSSRFTSALDHAVRFAVDHADAGSPRYGELLAMPDLRHWRLKGFPWLLIYIVTNDGIDLVRVLHSHADIPRSLEHHLRSSS